jgi:phosphocarrier protein
MWRSSWVMAREPAWSLGLICPCCCAVFVTDTKVWSHWRHVPTLVEHRVSCPLEVQPHKIKQEQDMPQATTTISNKLGLHARASAKLTKLAGSFPCDVWLSKGERRINAKSIMGVMMLAAGIGSEVVLETSGERDQEALDALLALMADKFGEGE